MAYPKANQTWRSVSLPTPKHMLGKCQLCQNRDPPQTRRFGFPLSQARKEKPWPQGAFFKVALRASKAAARRVLQLVNSAEGHIPMPPGQRYSWTTRPPFWKPGCFNSCESMGNVRNTAQIHASNSGNVALGGYKGNWRMPPRMG